jgi:hypothetical protein
MILEPLRILERWKVFSFGYFVIKKLEGKFILSPTIGLIGFSVLKKVVNKDEKSITV